MSSSSFYNNDKMSSFCHFLSVSIVIRNKIDQRKDTLSVVTVHIGVQSTREKTVSTQQASTCWLIFRIKDLIREKNYMIVLYFVGFCSNDQVPW